MINEAATVPHDDALKVIEGVELSGQMNVTDDVILANITAAIRLPYPQIRPQPANYDRIALVGSGPSLPETLPALVQAVREGAKLVTVNGAYAWCLAQNLQPRTQIVMDARPSNARFLEPETPLCRYVLASQCAPELWAAVAGRPEVWMFHAIFTTEGPVKDLLDRHYLGNWFGVGGGVTVLTRAISLLRTLGYVRFDIFGADSCWMGGVHHAFPQAENDRDKCVRVRLSPTDRPDLERRFLCSPWHVKQLEDFLQMIRVNGDHFLLKMHGTGLLAYALESNADVNWSTEQECG